MIYISFDCLSSSIYFVTIPTKMRRLMNNYDQPTHFDWQELEKYILRGDSKIKHFAWERGSEMLYHRIL